MSRETNQVQAWDDRPRADCITAANLLRARVAGSCQMPKRQRSDELASNGVLSHEPVETGCSAPASRTGTAWRFTRGTSFAQRLYQPATLVRVCSSVEWTAWRLSI